MQIDNKLTRSYLQGSWRCGFNKHRYNITNLEERGETKNVMPSWSLKNFVKQVQMYHHESWRTWLNKYRYTIMNLEELG